MRSTWVVGAVAVGGIAEDVVLVDRIAVGDRVAEDAVGWAVVHIGVGCIVVVGHTVAGCTVVVDCTEVEAGIVAAG